MKLLFLITVLSLLCIVTYAGEDTLRISVPVRPPVSLSDTILLQNHDLIYRNPITPDYKQFDKTFDTSEKEIAFSFEKQKSQNNIFNSSYSKILIPVSLITFGMATRNTKSLDEMDIAWNESGKYNGKKTSVDDYIRYTPYIGIYGLDLIGIKAKNNIRDRTFVTITSFLIMDQTVNLMKDNIPTWRPDGSNRRSFPSSHTSTAFVGAHIMFKEYKDSSPWAASSGYLLAATTGALRVVNEKHSPGDVVAGAGISILSVEAGYLLLPVFQKIFGFKDKNKNLVFFPSVIENNFTLGTVYNF